MTARGLVTVLARQSFIGLAYIGFCLILPLAFRASPLSRIDTPDLVALFGLPMVGYLLATGLVGLPVISACWDTRGWWLGLVLVTVGSMSAGGLAYGLGTGRTVAQSSEFVAIAATLGLPLAAILLWTHDGRRAATGVEGR